VDLSIPFRGEAADKQNFWNDDEGTAQSELRKQRPVGTPIRAEQVSSAQHVGPDQPVQR
jgi:hypothetical protein